MIMILVVIAIVWAVEATRRSQNRRFEEICSMATISAGATINGTWYTNLEWHTPDGDILWAVCNNSEYTVCRRSGNTRIATGTVAKQVFEHLRGRYLREIVQPQTESRLMDPRGWARLADQTFGNPDGHVLEQSGGIIQYLWKGNGLIATSIELPVIQQLWDTIVPNCS